MPGMAGSIVIIIKLHGEKFHLSTQWSFILSCIDAILYILPAYCIRAVVWLSLYDSGKWERSERERSERERDREREKWREREISEKRELENGRERERERTNSWLQRKPGRIYSPLPAGCGGGNPHMDGKAVSQWDRRASLGACHLFNLS